jgi:DNA-binding response OmpR family regulator
MKKRIILVDESPRDRRLFEAGFKARGFDVVAFATKAEALGALAGAAARPAELLVSTERFSDPAGSSLLDRLNQAAAGGGPPAPGWLVLLSPDQRAQRSRALEAGAEDALVKPIPVTELVALAEAVCKRRARARFAADPMVRGATLTGELDELGVADLLSVLEERAQSGIVRLEAPVGAKGTVYVRRGKPIDAEMAKLSGLEALSHLAAWSQGTYRIELKTTRRADRMPASVDDVMIAALQAAPAVSTPVPAWAPPPVVAPGPAVLPPPSPPPMAPAVPPDLRSPIEEIAADEHDVLVESESEVGLESGSSGTPAADDDASGPEEIAAALEAFSSARSSAAAPGTARSIPPAVGISDDNAEAYEAELPRLAIPPVSLSAGAPASPPAAASARPTALDELASLLDGLGGKERSEEDGLGTGDADPAQLEGSIARPLQERAGGAAAEPGLLDDGDVLVSNLTLPLGLAGHDSRRGLPAREPSGSSPPDDEDIDPDLLRQMMEENQQRRARDADGAPAALEPAAPRAAGRGDMLDGLAGVTPTSEDAPVDATALASSTRPTEAAPSDSALPITPPPAYSWLEGLDVPGAPSVGTGAGGPGEEELSTEEALRELGIGGGRRRVLRFAVLAVGVGSLLGVVGVHHAVAKRRASVPAAHSRTVSLVEPSPSAKPGKSDLPGPPPGPARAPSPPAPGTSASAGTPAPGAWGPGIPAPGSAGATTRVAAAGSDHEGEDDGKADAVAPTTPARRHADGTDAPAPAGPAPTPGAGGSRRDIAHPPVTGAPAAEATHLDDAAPGGGRRAAHPEVAAAADTPAERARFAGALATCRSRLDRGRPEEAARACQDALVARPDSADAHAVLAHAELNLRHLDRAIADARRAIALDPALAEPYLILGGALQDSGHSHEAGVAYRAYLRRAPNGRYASELRVIVSTM